MPNHKVKYCPKGHDTEVCGRTLSGGGCRDCSREYQKRVRVTPEYKVKAAKEYRAKWRNNTITRMYGISESIYNDLLLKQDSKCAICGIHKDDLKKALFVDHDHATGQVRGLLCNRCNFGLGYFKDSANSLRNAAHYLTGGRL